jgi:succinoglycan biosynthesis transport protein ExoP
MTIESRKSTIPASLVPDHAIQGGGLESDDLSFRQAIRIVRKRKYVVLWTAIILGGLVFGISFFSRPYYNSTAAIEVQKNQSDLGGGSLGALASTLTGEDDVKTEIQTEVSVLESDDLGIETIERTNFEAHQKEGWHPFGVTERPAQERGLPLDQTPRTRENLLKDFESHLKITPLPDTRLVQIEFEDPDAKFAADTTNAFIDQYVQDRLQRRNSSTQQATGWMTGEIDDLKKQVQTSQQRLIDYQRQSGLIVMPSVGGQAPGQLAAGATVTSPVLDRLTQLNTDLVAAETNRISQEALYELAKAGDVDALSSMGSGLQASGSGSTQAGMFDGLLALRQQETNLKLQLATAIRAYGEKNPHLIDLDNQYQALKQEMNEEMKRIVNTTEMSYRAALRTEDGVRSAYNVEEQKAYKMNDSEIRLAVLQQEADSTRALYEDLYTKLQESKLSEGTQSSNIAVISRGLVPFKPMHPKKVLNTAIGLMAGLILGVIATFALESLDDSVTNIDEIEMLSGLPVLAAIPQLVSPTTALLGKRETAPMLPGVGRQVSRKSSQELSEAYRTLRTAILLSHPGTQPRTLLVTSAIPGEGKTTTCYGLGACFAMLGNRVLLIDADMRRPALHRRASLTNDRGLSNLLTSASEPEDFIIEDVNLKNLFILPAGPAPPNPAELLAAGVFGNLVDNLSAKFDMVLIDSPPAMLVSDAAIMSVKVDQVIVVIRWGSTTRSALRRVFENFRRNKAKVMGTVLNAVNTKSSEYYYDSGYYGTDYASEGDNA